MQEILMMGINKLTLSNKIKIKCKILSRIKLYRKIGNNFIQMKEILKKTKSKFSVINLINFLSFPK
jgi:hypothetical protein